jgi:predicted CXXCH cytochrome family protein
MTRPTCLITIALSSLLLTAATSSAAQTASHNNTAPAAKASVPAHPIVLAANTPAAKCLECHSGIQSGKYVHTAMSMGCTTCHNIETKSGMTHVTLVSPANKLCEICHALSTDKVLHGPYREGLCVTCHSPHSSDFPAHLWASEQDTCLGCHARARLKVDQTTKTVKTPWGKTLTLQEMKGWQYLNLNKTLTANHPVEGHPVTGPNLKAGMPQVSCLSCHKAHASPYKSLLTAGAPKDMRLCATCGVCEQCHESLF